MALDLNSTLDSLSRIATAAGVLATLYLQWRASKKLTSVHELVNGVSHELQDAKSQVAFSEGEKAGAINERAAQAPPHLPD